MKLYHFTGLRRLLGDEGFDAWSAALDEGDVPSAIPYATPDAILKGGLKPFRTDDLDGALRTPLPACVWLSSDPAMPQEYCSWRGWRITLVISSSDRKLVLWPKYFRKHEVERDAFLALPEEQRRVSQSFYMYFGPVAATSFRALDRWPVADIRQPVGAVSDC